MGLGFDIFKLDGDGSPIWVEVRQLWAEALRRVEELRLKHPGTYLIHDSRTGHKTVFGAGAPAEQCAE